MVQAIYIESSSKKRSLSQIGMYWVTKNNPSGNFFPIYWIQTQYILLLGEQVLTIFLCIKRVSLNWNFIVNDVQSATYSSRGAPCPAVDLFPLLNARVRVHISLLTIHEYPKRHFRYLSDSGDTFLTLSVVWRYCPNCHRGCLYNVFHLRFNLLNIIQIWKTRLFSCSIWDLYLF